MFKIIGLVVVVLVIAAAVYYFGFYKKGKINDRDGDYIPDEVEDTIEDVKAAAIEAKRRVKNVKEEFREVHFLSNKRRITNNASVVSTPDRNPN